MMFSASAVPARRNIDSRPYIYIYIYGSIYIYLYKYMYTLCIYPKNFFDGSSPSTEAEHLNFKYVGFGEAPGAGAKEV